MLSNYKIKIPQKTLNHYSSSIQVIFTGRPEPKVVWFVDEENLNEVEDVEIVTENYRSTLTIPEVFSEDEGEYKVEITNVFGKAVSTAYIKIGKSSRVMAATENLVRGNRSHKKLPVQ